jgi:hypothetical protein
MRCETLVGSVDPSRGLGGQARRFVFHGLSSELVRLPPGYDSIPAAGARSQDPVIANLMRAGWRYEGCQPFEQLSPLHHDMRRSVAPGRLQTIGEPPIGHRLEAVEGEGRTRHVSTQPLESSPIVLGDGHVGVQAHPAVSYTAGRDPGPRLHAVLFLFSRRLHPVPETTPRISCLGAGRDPRSDGCVAERRHQEIVGREWIFLHRDPLPLEPAQDASSRACEYARHVLGLGRWQWGEETGHRRRPRVDTVEHEGVEVGREVQRGAKALDERDRAASSAPDPEIPFRSPPLVGEDGPQETTQHLTRQPSVPGTAVAKRVRKREHPLPDRDFGQYVVDEMGGGIGHAPTSTRRTESPAFAREGDEPNIEQHQTADQSYLEEGVQLLELARNAQRLFAKHEAKEKCRLRDFPGVELLFEAEELIPSGRASLIFLRKPWLRPRRKKPPNRRSMA